ncbi:hypothetical protein CHUAL_009828 [Chamberlinius hualienensis]
MIMKIIPIKNLSELNYAYKFFQPFLGFLYLFGINLKPQLTLKTSLKWEYFWFILRVLWLTNLLLVCAISLDSTYDVIQVFGFYKAIMPVILSSLHFNNLGTLVGLTWKRVTISHLIRDIVLVYKSQMQRFELAGRNTTRQISILKGILILFWSLLFVCDLNFLVTSSIRFTKRMTSQNISKMCDSYVGVLIQVLECSWTMSLLQWTDLMAIFVLLMGMSIMFIFVILISLLNSSLDLSVRATDNPINPICSILKLKYFLTRHREHCLLLQDLNDGFSFLIMNCMNIISGRIMDLDKFAVKGLEEELTKLKVDFDRYSMHIAMHRPIIDGWGYFDVNKPFLMTVGGTVLSYTLLLYHVS